MSNIINVFKNKNALIGFIMAGDPDLATTKNCIVAMAKAGADMIELGIPFSDPIAESSIVQNANMRALKSETYLNKVLEMVEETRELTKISIVIHSYCNPIFNYGYEKFFAMCAKAKIDGVVIPDLPYEEKSEMKEYADKYQTDIISFIVPSDGNRIKQIAKDATGFVYFVPSIGATGAIGENSKEITSVIETIREVTNIPIAIGFGINTKPQAEYFSKIADGIIIGNAVVKIIEKYGKDAPEYVESYIREMKSL